MSEEKPSNKMGTIAAFAAYGMWGLFPLYWKALSAVDPVQILCHRIVWAAGFTLLLLSLKKGGMASLWAVFKNARRAFVVALCSILITANWGIYIWAVNTGRVSDSSLGYYINPIISVALGAVFLGEKLDRYTVAAISIAAAGIAYAAIALGSVPWVSLSLALTFALYGLLKKMAGLDPLTGLAAETLVAAPFALAWLVAVHVSGDGSFGVPANGGGALVTLMLFAAGAITAIPLFAFAYAANRISLQRMGFIQYLSPSCQLALGVFVYGERPSAARLVAFAGVALAVIVYAASRGYAAEKTGDGPGL